MQNIFVAIQSTDNFVKCSWNSSCEQNSEHVHRIKCARSVYWLGWFGGLWYRNFLQIIVFDVEIDFFFLFHRISTFSYFDCHVFQLNFLFDSFLCNYLCHPSINNWTRYVLYVTWCTRGEFHLKYSKNDCRLWPNRMKYNE